MKILYLIISVFFCSVATAQEESPEAVIEEAKLQEKQIIQSVKRSYDSTNKALTKIAKKPEPKLKVKPPVIIYRTIIQYRDTCLTKAPPLVITISAPEPADSLVYEPQKKKSFLFKLFHKKSSP